MCTDVARRPEYNEQSSELQICSMQSGSQWSRTARGAVYEHIGIRSIPATEFEASLTGLLIFAAVLQAIC